MENFEERIQLRRALLDGENAVRELLVDRGKAQVAISQWETDGPPVDTNNAGTSEETKTPRSIQQWNQNLRSVQTKLAHAAQTNEDLKVPEAVWPAAGSITSDDEINILRFCSCVGKAR